MTPEGVSRVLVFIACFPVFATVFQQTVFSICKLTKNLGTDGLMEIRLNVTNAGTKIFRQS